MKKGVQKEVWRKRVKDSKAIPVPETVSNYLASNARLEIKARIRAFGKKHVSTFRKTHLKEILGYFFLEISIDNANRAGELINLTLDQFQECKKFSRWVKNSDDYRT